MSFNPQTQTKQSRHSFLLFLSITGRFHRIISALWNDSREVNKGPKDQGGRVQSPVYPAVNPLEIVAPAHSRFLFKAAALNQHESSTRQGRGLPLWLCLSLPLSSHQHTKRHNFEPTSCAGSKAVLLCVKDNKVKKREKWWGKKKKKKMRDE